MILRTLLKEKSAVSESMPISSKWFHLLAPRQLPDSKVHVANMGPTRVLSAPDGPHVRPMNLAIRAIRWLEPLLTCEAWEWRVRLVPYRWHSLYHNQQIAYIKDRNINLDIIFMLTSRTQIIFVSHLRRKCQLAPFQLTLQTLIIGFYIITTTYIYDHIYMVIIWHIWE